jgi:hypothetical protein
MKKLLSFVVVVLLSTSAFAATKCVSDGRGGVCCWDTEKDGPWKPISC